MKKTLVSFISLCCATIMLFAFVGCDNKTSNTDPQHANVSSESKPDENQPNAAKPSNGKFATIAEYVKSKEMQDQISKLKESMSSLPLEIEITGDGNKLIYTYTYKDEVKTEGLAENLATSLEPQAGTFKNVASSLSAVVDVESPVVVIRYLTKNKEVIYEQTFTAE